VVLLADWGTTLVIPKLYDLCHVAAFTHVQQVGTPGNFVSNATADASRHDLFAFSYWVSGHALNFSEFFY
jgi:hypothetical protein